MPRNQKVLSPNGAVTPVIVLTGGGSGGHIIPLLSLAHAIKQKDPNSNVIYIGHKGDKFDNGQVGYHDFDFVSFINGGKFRRYHGESFLSHLFDFKTLFLNIRDFFRVIQSVPKAMRILSKVNADVVFSKGGFVAVPVGLAAKLKRIPIVTHDSDAMPGLANRIVGRWAKIHATGMPPEAYSYPRQSIRYTGIPVDVRMKPVTKAAQEDFKKQIGVNSSSTVLLIAGGGLGSQSINEKIVKIAPTLLSADPALHIVHITGGKHEEDVKNQYAKVLGDTDNKHVTVLGFTSEFYKYTGAADLIISRAGASVLAEYAAQGKACVIIPSPFLASGHQLKNAEQLKKSQSAEIVDEEASPESLLGVIIKLMQNPTKRKILAENLSKNAKPGAAQELAGILLEVVNKK